MTQSNAPGSKVLAAHGATACTDVTGFGLIGHLVEMMRAARKDAMREGLEEELLRAVLTLADVPVLPGAAECVAAKIFSSLQASGAASLPRHCHVKA